MNQQEQDAIPLDWAGDVLSETATDDEMDLEWMEIFWSDRGAGYADNNDEEKP